MNNEGLLGGWQRDKEEYSEERVLHPGREFRPSRPRSVSPDPDRTPAPVPDITKPYLATEGGYFVPGLLSPNSCLIEEELCELRALLHEFRGRFIDGTRPLSATYLLKARLDTGNTTQISFHPRRLSLSKREVLRSAVAELDAK